MIQRCRKKTGKMAAEQSQVGSELISITQPIAAIRQLFSHQIRLSAVESGNTASKKLYGNLRPPYGVGRNTAIRLLKK
jgi:hypothetical protein